MIGSPLLPALQSALASGRIEILDLTAPLSPTTPVLQLPPPFANTIALSLETVSAFDDDGPMWKWHNIHTGSTPAPTWTRPRTGSPAGTVGRWIRSRPSGWSVPPWSSTSRLRSPPIRTSCCEPSHLLAWEDEYGRIPDNAWVLLRTGWSARGGDQATFLNADATGPHTPGPSVEAARWLADERAISGTGSRPSASTRVRPEAWIRPFPAHYFLLGAGKLGLTQLQQLDRLPTTGALLFVQPLRLVGGTGSPARVLALVERS